MEDDRLCAVEQDTVVKVKAQGASENAALDVAADANEVVRRIGVCHALDVLLDDRAFVEFRRDEMHRRTISFTMGNRPW